MSPTERCSSCAWTLAAALAASASLPGCSIVDALLPDARTPTTRAQEVVAWCAEFPEDSVARRSLVETVEPAYSYVHAAMLREPRLRGARLRLRPAPGLSREALERGLQCHQARVLLGMAAARDEDPYFLPGVWLDIEADSEGAAFEVAVRATAYADAQEVLQRARRFVARVQ
ncbi:MAG TPA: hypothetical protein VE987_11160 [Polyangiaceae bacterium]|nr:hypothetical protein [Polyangiaceae bacterium]